MNEKKKDVYGNWQRHRKRADALMLGVTSKVFLFLGTTTCLCACSSSAGKEPLVHPEKQYLLTNEISITGRPLVAGASSFLIELEGSAYLCTAKHLTRTEMGFEPSLDLDRCNDSLAYWNAFPRTQVLSSEKLETTKLLHNGNEAEDVILLRLKQQPKETGVLQPRFTGLKEGDRLRILGCEYADPACYQKEFCGTFQQYAPTEELIVLMDSSNVQLAGMSGAPVVDDQLKVVGVVSGGLDRGGKLQVYISPIDFARRINKQ